MIDVPDNTPKPDGRKRPNPSWFKKGNRIGAKGRGKGAKGKLTKAIYDLAKGTIARRGAKCRLKLAAAGIDVADLTDAECWIDSLDEDQFLKVLTHLLPKGVELTAFGDDGEPVRPIFVMYGSKRYEAAAAVCDGDNEHERLGYDPN